MNCSARTSPGVKAVADSAPLVQAGGDNAVDVLLRVRGIVQGVGFRPFVHRIAQRHSLRGWVCNDPQGVLIRAVGPAGQIDALELALHHEAPRAARVNSVVRSHPHPRTAPASDTFVIAPSAADSLAVEAALPPDLALCTDCRRELRDPADRRRGYPFINCTQCGPRYSLLESLPYDRSRTTMRAFRMCSACRHEYDDPADRRFHAQPNACPICGPHLTLVDAAGSVVAERDESLRHTVRSLQFGRIVAVKGLGGFHLMCDATNGAAVRELRRRKHREEKPLAVMFPDLASLRDFATVSAEAADLLLSPMAPIVLVPRKADTVLAPEVAPGNPWIGALLPSTPLHVVLLAAAGRPLVATSANLSDEPLCTEEAEARTRLAGVADFFLGHDRPIAHPVDDSVVRLDREGQPILLRRARGYAPAPVFLPAALPEPIVCVGAQMKNAVAVAAGDRVVLSPHIGDLGNAATQRVFTRTLALLGELYPAAPAVIVHDKHPDYASTSFAQKSGLPCLAVQHHLAHVLACLLEHRQAADGVLGIAWDGTGYGEDGTVWGGEFILLERTRATRFAHLRPFRLPGGEAAVRNPRRAALGLLHAGELGDVAEAARGLGFSAGEASALQAMMARGLNSPVCSSAGRLFDGVGALLGLGCRNAFEGQTPLAVEAAAWSAARSDETLPLPLRPATSGAAFELDWAPLVARLLADRAAPGNTAAAFHRALADAMVEVARRAGVGTVVLTGGCFQNVLLHDLAATGLRSAGFRVLVHRELTPNDGSIAAGQALAALWKLTSVELT